MPKNQRRARARQADQHAEPVVPPPDTVDRPQDVPGCAFALFSHWGGPGVETPVRSEVAVMTIHAVFQRAEDATAWVERLRADQPIYKRVDFVVQRLGSPFCVPVDVAKITQRTYLPENSRLQELWAGHREAEDAQQAKVRARTRAALDRTEGPSSADVTVLDDAGHAQVEHYENDKPVPVPTQETEQTEE